MALNMDRIRELLAEAEPNRDAGYMIVRTKDGNLVKQAINSPTCGGFSGTRGNSRKYIPAADDVVAVFSHCA